MLKCDSCCLCRYGNDVNCPFYEANLEDTDIKQIKRASRGRYAPWLYLATCYLYGHRLDKNQRKAISILKKLCRKEYVPAQYILSLCYFDGIYTSKDSKQAYELCAEAARKGCNLAEIKLYECYRDGIGVGRDLEQAKGWCGSAAHHKSKEMYYKYAEMCCCEKYGKPNFKTACDFYELLLADGNETASVRLKELHENHLDECFGGYQLKYSGYGQSYYEERGDFCINNKYAPNIRKALSNYKKALSEYVEVLPLYEKCAEKLSQIYNSGGHTLGNTKYRICEVKTKISNCYEQYFAQEAAPEQATIYKKALQGDAIAQYELGKLFYDKDFELFDYSEAVHWFELSAEKGYAGAQTQLAYCYMMGFGVEKNEAQAFKWSQLAAQKGNAAGQCYLAWCYENAFGVQRNYQEAFKWYKASAEHGNTASQYHLGLCYENGYGTEKSLLQAASWISKSASKLYLLAQARMGVYYAKGLGVPKSLQEAAKYYKLAAEQGHAISQYNLGVCYCNGEGVTQNYAEAVKWYTLAAEQNCAVAQNNLASCYFYGYGVNANLYKAKELYERSAKNGYKKATANLQTCKEKMAN